MIAEKPLKKKLALAVEALRRQEELLRTAGQSVWSREDLKDHNLDRIEILTIAGHSPFSKEEQL